MNKIVTPKLLIPTGPFRPSPLADVLGLAGFELPRWEEQMAAIEGPTAALSYISTWAISHKLLQEGGGWPLEMNARLHTGNPGTEGINNKATESKMPVVKWEVNLVNRYRTNEAAVEWHEVSTKENYTFVSFWWGTIPQQFMGYCEVAEVKAEVGDSALFNKGALKIEVP